MLTPKAAKQSRSSGFISLETIAIMVVVVLVIIVTIAILFTPQLTNTNPIQAPVDTLPASFRDPQVEQRDIRYINPDSPFTNATLPDTEGKSFNERMYDDNKKSFVKLEYQVQGTRFKGKILSIDTSNGMSLKLESLLGNSLGVEVVYVFDPTTLPKITVKDGALDTLSIGQEINIDETNDYTKPYPESIQTIEISTIQ